MTTFSQTDADAIVGEIGASVLDSDLSTHPWHSAVMIANLDGSKGMFGYCFWSEDGWEAATPDGFDTLFLFIELQNAMAMDGVLSWKKARLKVTRATRKIEIDFDPTGEKWVPDYADPGRFARRLRDERE